MVYKLCVIPLLLERSLPLEVRRSVANTKQEPVTAADKTLPDTNKW
jgi:hypothetical protein